MSNLSQSDRKCLSKWKWFWAEGWIKVTEIITLNLYYQIIPKVHPQMRLRNLHLFIVILTMVLISSRHLNCYPRLRGGGAATRNSFNVRRPMLKKNVFISRGWGASGLPLSTSASTLTGTADLKHNGLERLWQPKPKPSKFLRQRNQGGGGHHQQRNYSVPQLFVSYGWGPMGWD